MTRSRGQSPVFHFRKKVFREGVATVGTCSILCVSVEEEEEEREKRKGEEEERVGFSNRGRAMGVENNRRVKEKVSVCKYWKKPLS